MITRSGIPTVVFRCDASELIGGGHAMRCLTLANALSEEGATITFVTAAMPEGLAGRVESCGHRLVRIPSSPELHRPAGKWEEPPLSNGSQSDDARATAAVVSHADWVVVDHYLLDARWHSTARDFADRILVIDDLANRSYDCDILLDQTFGRTVEDYQAQVSRGAKVLVGPTFALLRPEFARERPAALERRKRAGPVRRILISMGTSDPGGITARIVEAVLAIAPECAVDAVVGSNASSLDRLRDLAARHAALSIHVDSNQMAIMMREADIAVGAAGSTTWERCCLGLPSIALVLAENQSFIADGLSAAGAHMACEADDEHSFARQLRKLLLSSATRQAVAVNAARMTDGLGSTRVRAAMESLMVDEGSDG